MTKSIIAERKNIWGRDDNNLPNKDLEFEQLLSKFLAEFGIKDSQNISRATHLELMTSHFYWVDREKNLGYHIPDNISGERRKLSYAEDAIYEYLYNDAVQY